jgi:hypothetical protein
MEGTQAHILFTPLSQYNLLRDDINNVYSFFDLGDGVWVQSRNLHSVVPEKLVMGEYISRFWATAGIG